jgi:hypothetical protein
VRMMRTAISPRFAIRTLLNKQLLQPGGAVLHEKEPQG